MAAEIDRRLTTVLSADIAGYSTLMQRDEDGTLVRLRDYLARLTRLIEHHRGRIANTAGDAVLAEFPSTVEAVRAAIDIQRELAEQNGALAEGEQMRFRIGINVGDVMLENGDLFGEGVNVAARLQSMAAPGGILVSGPVRDLIRGRLDIGFDFLGPQHIKNMTGEVDVYAVHLDAARAGRAEPPPIPDPPPAAPQGPAAAPGLKEAIAPLVPQLRNAGMAILAASAASLVTGEEAFGILATIASWIYLAHTARQSIAHPRHRRAAQLILTAAMLAALNFATGPFNIWFHYPAIPLLIVAWLTEKGSIAPSDERETPQAKG